MIKKFLYIVVLVLSIFVVSGCGSKKVSTRGMWDKFVEAYNTKDLDKLAAVYYKSDAEMKTWKENVLKAYGEDAEGYFLGITVETVSYKSTVSCDLSTKSKTEKFYAADVVCNISDGINTEEVEFEVYLMDKGQGIHFVSEISFVDVPLYAVVSLEQQIQFLNQKQSETEDADESANLTNQIEELTAIYTVLNSYYQKGLGQQPTDEWLKGAYYETSKYVYQKFYGQEDVAVVDEEGNQMYEFLMSGDKILTDANGNPLYDKTTPAVRNVKKLQVCLSKQVKNVKKLEIPEEIDGCTVTAIDSYSFFRTTRLLTFTIKSSKLTKVTFPETLTSIGKYAFYQCGSLKEINIGESIKTIGSNAFASCVNVKKITIDLEDRNAFDYADDEKKELIKDQDSKSSANGAGIKILGAKTAVYQGDISTLTVEGINKENIKWEVTGAVLQETKERHIVNIICNPTNESNVTVKAYDAIDPTKNATVTFKVLLVKPIKTIDATAFDRCNSLKSLYIFASNPYSVAPGNGTQFSISKDAKIYVPEDAVEKFKHSSIWSKYADQIFAMSADEYASFE